MPELPEVITVANKLNNKLQNKTILSANLIYPKLLKKIEINDFLSKISNQKIIEVSNIAKYVVFILEDFYMVSHLRMEGKWTLENHKDIFDFKESWLELEFHLSSNDFLRYYDSRKFGTLNLFPKDEYRITNLPLNVGPTFINEDINFEYLYNKTKNSNKKIKNLLLDQTNISGLGNIYVNEVLFESLVHPESISKNLSQKEIKNIFYNSKTILTNAIAAGGTTIHSFKSDQDTTGTYQNYLKIHGKKSQNCVNCNTKITFIKVSGRGSFICENCQKIK